VITIILNLIGSLLSVAGKIFDILHERQMIDAGKTEQQLADLKAKVEAAHRSVSIRNAVERAINTKPDSLLNDDDGFKRPDSE
jgi:hypothetical protein